MRTEGEETWHKQVTEFIHQGTGIILRLRGLPYECSANDVVDFFLRGNMPAQVLDGERGVFFIKKPDGKATGDALVQFASEEELTVALRKHKESIGSRYIELFRTPASEVLQVVRRTLEGKSKAQNSRQSIGGMISNTLSNGSTRDCIHLRGLPFEAQVPNLLAFLGENANNIRYHGVHMIYNHLGQPTGEAFIQMVNEEKARYAATVCHKTTMEFQKKHRVIDVIQCSGEDMMNFLQGTQPSPGITDGLPPPPFVSLFPPNLMEPLRALPPGHPGPLMYVMVNPMTEPFFPFHPPNEWLPEFPPSPIPNVPQFPHQQNDHFISLRDI